MNRQKIVAVILGIAGVLLAACGSDEGASSATPGATATSAGTVPATTVPATNVPATTVPATSPPATTVPLGSDAAFPGGLRNVRYCEVLLLSQEGEEFVAAVWNTIGLDECMQAEWDALDAAQIAADRGALAAVLNGPRYWMLDTIISDIRDGAATTTFGDIDMFLAATTRLGSELPNQAPYIERVVVRDTVFLFRAGSEVYELTDPGGQVYVMQSYSQKIDSTMSMERLPELGTTLQLPEGWTYTSRVLADDLRVLDTDGIAVVVQDEFQNTYQRIDVA
ncbi:MAG: hypothetical protein Q7V57_00210 [Actinomycetota bacterium]|nr:hypothetical protein [Actinomycetota bacterium]